MIRKKYTLSSYEPVIIEIPKPPVPEDLVNRQITRMLEQLATFLPVEETRAIVPDDYVYITTADAQFNGSPAPSQNLTHALYHIGAGDMPHPFDVELVGMMPNEVKSISIGGEEDGAVPFMSMTVTVDAIVTCELPELTNEFVKEHFPPAETVGELRRNVEKDFTIPDMPKDDPRFLNIIMKELVSRLVELPSRSELKPKQPMESLMEDCAVSALMNHMDIHLTEEEIIEQMPGQTHLDQKLAYDGLIGEGFEEEMLFYAKRGVALNWLIENSRVSFV